MQESDGTVHGGGLANLQLGLALPNNSYYEDLVISAEQIRRKRQGAIPFDRGEVRLPEGTVGIGWEVDIEDVRKRALMSFAYP